MNKRQVSARRFCPPSTVLFHCCPRTFPPHYIVVTIIVLLHHPEYHYLEEPFCKTVHHTESYITKWVLGSFFVTKKILNGIFSSDQERLKKVSRINFLEKQIFWGTDPLIAHVLNCRTPVPERPISAYQGLIFVPFFYLPFFVLLKVTFCVIITVSQSKGSTVFCKLELHVLRQDNLD